MAKRELTQNPHLRSPAGELTAREVASEKTSSRKSAKLGRRKGMLCNGRRSHGRESVPEARAATREDREANLERSKRAPAGQNRELCGLHRPWGAGGGTTAGPAGTRRRGLRGDDRTARGGRRRGLCGRRCSGRGIPTAVGPPAGTAPGRVSGKSPAPRDRGGGVPLARTASRDAPLAAPGRPAPRREPGRSRPAHNKAAQPRQLGAGSQLPRLGGLRTARDDAPPAEAAPGPDRAGAVGAGRRAPLGTNFLCRPAPRPSAGPPRRVGRPAESQRPEGGRGESQGPAGNFQPPRVGPWPHAPRPCPFTSWGAVYTLRGVLVRGSGASRAGGPGASGRRCCWPHG